MPWNPEKYNQFKKIRYQPFFDLAELITADGLEQGVDIGCGTGEQTSILAEKFEQAFFLGIDPSSEMLAKSKELESSNLHFKSTTVESFIASAQERKWDLVFSNAALQWSDGHETLFPRLIALLSDKGQLAIQMPVQKENLLNQLLFNLVQEQPFAGFLQGWKRTSPLLSMDQYAQLMFGNGLHRIQVIQKVYPIIADDAEQLFDFIAGSSLIPYLERMTGSQQALFTGEYKSRIRKVFPRFPAIYPFKRLLLYGTRSL
ncbi:MAG: methyltransferase domain-containing protein [Chitinophagaceae bacterium]